MKKHFFFTAAIAAAFVIGVFGCSRIDEASASSCTVTYETNGFGETPKSISVAYGAKLTDAQLPVLTADGKLFAGWFKNSECTIEWNKDTDKVTKNITLYAKWKNTQPLIPLKPATKFFTVTFDTQGFGTAPAAIKVAKDAKITAEQFPNPTAEKKRFDGWYKESTCTTMWNKDSDAVTQDTTLYAKWTSIFTVTFNTQGFGTAPAPIEVVKGAKLTAEQLPNPTAEKKRFDGWYKESTCTTMWNKNSDTVTQDITLYAKWTPIFTVSFSTRGLSKVPEKIEVVSGEPISAMPQNPSHLTWNFEGWFKDKNNTQKWNAASDKVSESLTLYAKWTPKTVSATDLWKSKTDRPDDYYRIPALAETKDGTLLAVADLRYKHAADVGKYGPNGEWGGNSHLHRVDLVLKNSADYGINWSATDTNLTNVPDNPVQYGCGDAAIAADRDSDEVLILHVQGNVRYQHGKQSVMKLKSTDGGKTFTSTDITEQIYGMNTTSWNRMFVTSGKIHQSRFIKVDKYFRIYAAPVIGGFGNTVIYSDDFGDTWNVLGGDATARPTPAGDEAKVEELPDGRVILSSRRENQSGSKEGRFINIFTYTDKNSGLGHWESSYAVLSLGNDPGTNGELLIVKACEKNNKTPVYLALLSIPTVDRRKDVSIFWRTINENVSLADFATASKWTQKKIHTGTSAYSTMIQQKDGRIGFLYECNEQSSPAGYDIKYKSLTIHEITDGQYEAAFLNE